MSFLFRLNIKEFNIIEHAYISPNKARFHLASLSHIYYSLPYIFDKDWGHVL